MPTDAPQTPIALVKSDLYGASSWQDHAEAFLEGALGDFLDFGCGYGSFLYRVKDRANRLVGVDLDADKLAKAAEALPDAELITIGPDGKLPFANDTFDTISILEVIEHVPDEQSVLSELTRVLKPGGRLILTTPHKGRLMFLDPGNVKFWVPGLHRFIHTRLLRNRKHYEETFGGNARDKGMVGDITFSENARHRHYSFDELCGHAPDALKPVRWGAFFPYMRALSFLRLTLKALTLGRVSSLPRVVVKWRAKQSHRQTLAGDQLVVLFSKAE